MVELGSLRGECRTAVENFKAWNRWTPFSQECDALLERLTSDKKDEVINEIEQRFAKRLEFGTAGLRGPMGAGFNRMNDVTVMQASQGFALYLLQHCGQERCSTKGVVIGCDGRHNSMRFAHAAAAVFLSKGFKVWLSSKVTATPTCPYAVVKYGLVGGCQVTASHNPKNDNGFKVYAENGAQIIPPMDEDISNLILANLRPWDEAVALLDPTTGMLKDSSPSSKLVDPYTQVFKTYIDELVADLCSEKERISKSDLKITYTAMHGVGFPYVEDILARFGLKKENFIVVSEQQYPDPEFTTVSFPNPEEKGALDLAMATADRAGSPLVIANDPDADRFACAEKQPDGKWHIFKGDELGIIFGVECFERSKALGVDPGKMLFVCSAVSSRMLEKMAVTEGARFSETMTGFKWIMNEALRLQKEEGLVPIFSYEEALGYGVDMRVPDKDGISAAGIWVQMATRLYGEGNTVAGKLDQIRKKYGYFVTNNSYFLCYDKQAINDLFAEFRSNGNYCKSVGPFQLKRIRDVTTGYDNGQPDNKCAFPLSPSSQMITLYFTNGAHITVRTSGTEPKIKWYSELGGPCPVAAQAELDKVVDAAIAQIFQPNKYPLTRAGGGK